MEGSTISHYKVLEKIGQGGMGEVWKGEDLKLGRHVALKFLAPQIVSDPEIHKRFEREAKAAASLNNANICTIHELDTAGDRMFIVMEFVKGRSLRERIAERPVRLDEALDIAIQAGEGLQAAHESGVVHRDVKSGNLMLTPQGRVKVMDFGLAHLADQSQLTEAGASLGTPAYMSPEQARGDPVDRRTDVWALGVVVYEMIAGRLPFHGERTAAVAYAILNLEPEPLTALRTGLPIDLDRIVAKALAKDKKQRYPRVEDLLVDLRALRAPATETQRATGESSSRPRRRAAWVAVAACLGIALVATLFLLRRSPPPAMQESLLEVQSLAQEGRYFAAFRLARSIEEEAGDVPGLAPLWPLFTEEIDIETEPPGTEVLIEYPPGGETPALALGSTPLRAVRVPRENLRWRFDKAGFSPAERVARFDTPVFRGTSTETGRTRITVKLSPDASENSEMVRVLGGRVDVHSPGLGSPPILLVGDFWIDRHEVTNREFKSFVQGGGYAERRYWKVPFLRDGKKVSWEEAMAAFVDATGRPGPLLWEFSDYPKGQDDFPVTGVSWYEAAAYAEFVGKQLPTVYHWSSAGWNGSQAIPASNFSGEPAAAGTHNGISAFGAYDMFGNAKEWCWNATSDIEEFRYLIGGGWHEPSYQAGQADATSAFDRSPQHGFRLATELDSDGTDAAAFAPLAREVRDYTKTKPVPDETFELYASLYDYDASELAATVEPVEAATDYWRREKAEINAAYDGERMPVHLFFPTSGSPPWQVVIFFPGAGAFRLYPDLTNLEFVEALVRGGRAVAYPVYESSYERAKGDNTELHRPNPGTVWRDHVIKVAKDVGRAIDYIEARPDLDANKIAYVGLSRGAALGLINLAIEKRFKAAALVIGGLWQDQVRPEVDQINFCPRVTLPVLMVNGVYDFIFPVENSQRPMFEMLGTAPEHKKHVLLEGGHGLPRHEVVRELSVWLDRYLGTPGG